jgi:Prokaryotic E2 family E/Multiubiquitin
MDTTTQNQEHHFASGSPGLTAIEVAGTDLQFRSVPLNDLTPTGAQISTASGFTPDQQATVLRWLDNHQLEDVRPGETADLRTGSRRFIVVPSDRSYRLTLDGVRFDWPCAIVSGALLRKLGGVPTDKTIYFERVDQPDRLLRDEELINLDAQGVEAFHTRQATWVLNVQGVRLELEQPTILVSEAMTRAGFDINQGWHIFLKIVGQAKRVVELATVIDLRTPGIEKLRLTPKDVNNGEPPMSARRQFALLDVDEDFLDRHHVHWETIEDGGRRWLLLHGYPTPSGYNVRRVTLALEIATSYPGAQIDMFFLQPPVVLTSGLPLPNTEGRVLIGGLSYQQWSRHRGQSSAWRPETDNVVTHLALVESALAKEVAP